MTTRPTNGFQLSISAVGKFTLLGLLVFVWLIQGQTYPGGMATDFLFLRYLSYVIIAALIPLYLWRLLFHRAGQVPHGNGMLQWIFIMVLYIGLNALVQRSGGREVLESVFVYLRYTILYLVLLVFVNRKDVRTFFFVFVGVCVLVGLEAIVNRVFFGLEGDNTYLTLGPWGGHVNGGVLLLYATILFVAHGISSKFRFYHFAFFVLVIMASLIASNRGTLLLLAPLILVVLLIHYRKLHPAWLVCGALCFNAAILVFSHHVYHGKVQPQFSHDISPNYRLRYIGGVLDELKNNKDLLFGEGVRSMKLSNDVRSDSLYFRFFIDRPYLLRGGTNQYVKVVSELGLVGFILYFGMLTKVLLNNFATWKLLSRVKGATAYDRALSLGMFAVWMHYAAVGLIYNDFWRCDASALIFWSIALYIALLRRSLQSSIQGDSSVQASPSSGLVQRPVKSMVAP